MPEKEQIKWIGKDNFDLLSTGGSASLLNFLEENDHPDNYVFKVDWDDLTNEQKKLLPLIKKDYMLYITSRSRPPAELKKKAIKEEMFEKKDLITLIKALLKNKDSEMIYAMLIDYDVSPIVLSQWLFWPLRSNLEGLDCLLKLEKYIYNKDAYYVLLATQLSGEKLKGSHFRFPKKLRG